VFTEEEARNNRVCPFWVIGKGYTIHCDPHRCMMWRWAEWPGKSDKPRGYCGLAGKPEFYEGGEDGK